MENLLQSQIHEGCKLALPVGLQELMSDISREVLRSQPEDIYQFIANYLEALLNAREVLSIACRICREVSDCSCQPQLDDELSRIGLSHEDVAKAKNIILDHFDKGQVNETNLMIKLTTKTDMNQMQLVELQKAIWRSFQRYISKRKDLQVSFAKFGDSATGSTAENTSSFSSQSSAPDFYKPSLSLDALSALQDAQNKQMYPSTSYPECKVSVSATTLAGSFVNLPRKIPYSVHNSECDNLLIKSEKSVLNLLKSILFAESRQCHGIPEREENIHQYHSLDSPDTQNTDSEEIDDTVRSIFSQDIYDARPKKSKESQTRAMFRAIQENLNESSSGGS